MNTIYILIVLIPLLAVAGFTIGYWLRGRNGFGSSTGQAETAEPSPPQTAPPSIGLPHDKPPQLRLEAAAPEHALIDRPFDVIATLLPHGKLSTLSEVLRAAPEQVEPSLKGRRLSFRVHIEAPDLVCHSPAFRTIYVTPDGQPSIAVFSLSASQPGRAVVRVMIEQGLVEIGCARLTIHVEAAAKRLDSEWADASPSPTGQSAMLIVQTQLAVQLPEATRHLLAHVLAENYSAAELASLADELNAPDPAPSAASPFAVAIDLVHHVNHNGDLEDLAARVVAERPDWRRTIRGNRRARKFLIYDRS